jgi:hypothetical protein
MDMVSNIPQFGVFFSISNEFSRFIAVIVILIVQVSVLSTASVV